MSNVYNVLAKVQQKVNAPKDQFNSFGKYKFRNLESINAAAKPVCAENKAGYFLSDEVIKIDERFYVKATATFFADGCEGVATATAYAREENDKKGMDAAQITGLASSYARKYALCGLLAIDDNEDVDAMDNRPQPKQKAKPAAKVKPASEDDMNRLVAAAAEYGNEAGRSSQEVMDVLKSRLKVTTWTAETVQQAIATLNAWEMAKAAKGE